MSTVSGETAVRLPAGAWPGVAAALLTVSIWSGWIVATRYTLVHELGPVDVGLLRYGVPALVLLPCWWRSGVLPRGVPAWRIGVLVAGSGAPFLLVAATGMAYAPAVRIGVLLPGTMPLFAALLALAVLGERPGRRRAAGIVAIAAGVTAIGGVPVMTGTLGESVGHALFLGAALLWACYTVAFKASGLTPLQATAIVAFWSFAIHLVLALASGTRLAEVPASTLVPQVIAQGLCSGLIAIASYGYAVSRLGASRAAAFAALVPVLTGLGGIVFLGETASAADVGGILLTSTGVALATWPAPPSR